jgi:hypothetical protein
MIERNRFDCTYVEIFTHHIGSMGALRRTVFIRGTNTEHREVPNIASRNMKTNNSNNEEGKEKKGMAMMTTMKGTLDRFSLRTFISPCQLLFHKYPVPIKQSLIHVNADI